MRKQRKKQRGQACLVGNASAISNTVVANVSRSEKASLKMMDEIIPWSEWIELIRPCYSKGERDRPSSGIEVMLRIYLVQVGFDLSGEMVEDSVCGSCAIRKFMGLNFHDERTPEATMEKNGESSMALSVVWRSFGSL